MENEPDPKWGIYQIIYSCENHEITTKFLVVNLCKGDNITEQTTSTVKSCFRSIADFRL